MKSLIFYICIVMVSTFFKKDEKKNLNNLENYSFYIAIYDKNDFLNNKEKLVRQKLFLTDKLLFFKEIKVK